LLSKRSNFVDKVNIPSSSRHAASGVATAVGMAAKAIVGLGFTAGTGGNILFRGCPLIGAQIVDKATNVSVIDFFFPVAERYADGVFSKGYEIIIRGKFQGFRWVNRQLVCVEFNQYSGKKELGLLIYNKEELMNKCDEYFRLVAPWTHSEDVDSIFLRAKDVSGKRMSSLTFTVPRLTKKAVNWLAEQRKLDIKTLPEIVFDIAKNISESILFE